MTEHRQQILLSGHTALARKIFDTVPIQESWSESTILSTLRRSSTGASPHTVRACLLDMKDNGLIKEPSKGFFQRSPVNSTKPTAKPSANEASMIQTPTQPGKPKATLSPTDQLVALGTELSLMATDIGERVRAMALRIEEVALSVESQREEDAKLIEKANQLKDLLKGFGQ